MKKSGSDAGLLRNRKSKQQKTKPNYVPSNQLNRCHKCS